MLQLTIPTIHHTEDILCCPKHPIAHYMWRCTMKPEAYGQIAALNQQGFVIRLVSKESHPVTTYTNHFDPVYKDSAIEAFFQFGTLKSPYMNFEFNANGAVLAMYGTEREGRSRLDEKSIEALNIHTQKDEAQWSVTFFLPMDVIRRIYPDFTLEKGHHFSLNFYKISESPDIEHYGSMSKITLEHPDFHVPEFFASACIA